MLYGDIIAVCSATNTKHTNTLCGKNAEFFNVKPGRKGKGQVRPRTGHEGPEEVWLYSFFNICARWGGWSTPRPGRFTLGKETRYPLCGRLTTILKVARECKKKKTQYTLDSAKSSLRIGGLFMEAVLCPFRPNTSTSQAKFIDHKST
jgi:hypothetical protein